MDNAAVIREYDAATDAFSSCSSFGFNPAAPATATTSGDKWLVGDEGTPLILHHTDCDRDMHAVVTCSECAEPLTVRKVKGRRGPGYPAAGA